MRITVRMLLCGLTAGDGLAGGGGRPGQGQQTDRSAFLVGRLTVGLVRALFMLRLMARQQRQVACQVSR